MFFIKSYYPIYIEKKSKKSYKNNKFKISAPTCDDGFEMPGEAYFVSNIQNYFECIIKK